MRPLVLVDLDNTLVDRVAAFAKWARVFCDELAHIDDRVAALVNLDEDGLRRRDDFARGAAKILGSLDPGAVLSHYERTYPTCFVLSDAAEAALRELRRAGHPLAIVTNGPPFQETVVDNLGLRALVDAVCVSAVAGVRKPDRGIFDLAAERARAPLEPDSWMIGDSASADVAGAHNAGVRSIWIHRGRTWDMRDAPPTVTAGSFDEAARHVLEQG